ncbi:NAD(P)-dependent oxidoreductase [Sphingomonas dokdonensis]|uniref:D-3-phosphoglycerate dehydrogenase n=1 Tax=Sphingomonas dokdonensis TaxID=344880 RepID=A0A245ZMP2_9SPHN|nr:NAD(P)-dependent oxidoreductase [Sphingomonas dokdonensis]OWK31009.1 D-3-phosphoglycerate dehydrogenase [Sphingomonas dokdonensis]
MRIAIDTHPSAGFQAQIDAVFGAGAVINIGPGGAIGDAEILLHVLHPITPEAIAAAPDLRLIQKLGVGVNTIALDAAAARGVAVCNMPGVNAQAVAECALALILAGLRRTVPLDAATRTGQWAVPSDVLDDMGEIAGRTVGLVGMGASATRLARVLAALGAEVVYAARSAHDVPYRRVTRDQLVATADIVSLHVPLTDETRHIVDPLAMKRGAILINVARGGLVDETRLAAALNGHLRGAGLDVFATEPVSPADPLLALPNVTVSPHVAWQTPETLARSLAAAAENVRRLTAGEPLLNRIPA